MRIKTILPILALLLVIQTACKKDDDDVTTTVPQEWLTVEVQDLFVAPPSRVSVFFRVKDQDGRPIAGLDPSNFVVKEKGRNDDEARLISEDEAQRILSDNKQVFDYKVMLLLDLSGSVVNNDLTGLKEAAREFVIDVMTADVNSSTQIGIWWFDGADQLHPLIDFTSNAVAIQEAIIGINSSMTQDLSTDLFGAVIKATQLAEAELQASDIQGVMAASSVIVFTDGTDQAARYAREDAYEAVNSASQNINYYTIGLGAEIDETVLRKLGTDSSVFADDAATLAAKFEEIAQLIYDETNSFYLFEYCTPKRDGSGINDLVIQVVDGNREGETMTTFDATGFKSGCVLY